MKIWYRVAELCQINHFGPFVPNLVTRPQSPHMTKISEFNFCKMLVIKSWTKWGVGYKYWMIHYGAMSNILFWAKVGQNIVLGPRPPVILNFPNYLHQKEFLQPSEQNQGLFVKILYGVAELCQINHFRQVCPKTSY